VGACAACGQVNPGIARFCLACGAALGRAAGTAGEERKTVTVLFCDLVGFTAASDQADPEDVRARIRPYHARLRREVEGFGGTVEKFIGDAVMAVFGAPTAHEDDPERAVRTGLRILEAIADLNEADPGLGLAVRVGVETGEAVVALGAAPELGEGLATGDVVNTASRLQGAAPVGGVLAGPGTYAATREVFEYQALDPVALKGKAEPVAVFQAVAPRARLGTDVTRSLAAPMVGRQIDLGILTGAFQKAVQESTVQLVVVAGEPGVGKSRLVAELGSFVDGWPELVRWRQGRCLPYGEGITFWALGEIVKAEAGILESDPPDTAAAKIDAMIPADAREGPWLRTRLRPLAGLAAPEASREENFAAWRAFVELLAENRPTVLVVEDLHWADAALLEFLEQLTDHIEGVPLLLVATTRPELSERAPGWAAAARNLARVNLAPLAPTETARLISNLLGSAVLPAEVQQAIVDRAGGNPLYAEQFVHLLQDQQILTRAGTGWRLQPGAEIPVPPGVHGLIAARLDTLPAERKHLLHDAAVVGKVFWSGAVAEMADQDEAGVRAVLHELARTDLVRPARRSAMAGQAEYVFTHALIREVCYGQIPRAERARRHQRAAAWIEAMAGERAADLAEILAAHYTTALDLARATNDPHADELTESAARYLMLAGDRALGIDVAAAERHYAHALKLTRYTGPWHADLLARHAQALRQRARFAEAAAAFEQAIALFRGRGDARAAAIAMTEYSKLLHRLGDPRHLDIDDAAVAMLEPLGPSPELVEALAVRASASLVAEKHAEAVVFADRAIELATTLGLPLPVAALGIGGSARAALGDPKGLDDMRRALDAATAQGLGHEAVVVYLNLSVALTSAEGPQAKRELAQQGAVFAQRRGITEILPFLQAAVIEAVADLGLIEEARALTATALSHVAADDWMAQVNVRTSDVRLLVRRGEITQSGPLDWIEQMVTRTREFGEPQLLGEVLTVATIARAAAGEVRAARAALAELEQVPNVRQTPTYMPSLPDLVRAALVAGDPSLAARLADGLQPAYPVDQHAVVTARALLAEQRGQHADAAGLFADASARWERFEVPWEQAQALLGQGRCLLAIGQPGEAREPLRTARDIFTTLGARPALNETDKLLAQATALTA
jgi:class 3 adenylate cyclase/tetratricopeptide (TPR) repeat protein